jgi:hypothetical protein
MPHMVAHLLLTAALASACSRTWRFCALVERAKA